MIAFKAETPFLCHPGYTTDFTVTDSIKLVNKGYVCLEKDAGYEIKRNRASTNLRVCTSWLY